MKTKIISVFALFALLAVGLVFISEPTEAKTADASSVYNIDDPYSAGVLADCTRFCSWCVKYGRNGACTTSGACC